MTPTLQPDSHEILWQYLSAFPQLSAVMNKPTINALAIVSLVCGAISIPFALFCCWGLPFNLIGLITGGVAISQINGNPEEQTGKGMAIGGIVASLVSVGVTVIFMVFVAGSVGLGLLEGM